MTRVVLDTNIIVSAYLNQDGLPFHIFKLGLARAIRICVSEPVLAEYQELLHRKSYPLDRRRAGLLLRTIRAVSDIVKPAGKIEAARDPDDNMFLECAEAAKAHYLITGNSRDFPKRWKYTSVVTPSTFVDFWTDTHRSSGM